MEHLLSVVRRVFAGEITRQQLAHLSIIEQVFAGHGVILAVRYNLDENNVVQGPYSYTLEALLITGTVNYWTNEKCDYRFRDDLVDASKRAGMYTPSRGLGGNKPITISPPKELMVLVAELGCTPAIEAFLRDAATGVEQEKLWQEEYKLRLLREERQGYMDEVVRHTEQKYGIEGLEILRAIITTRLNE